MLDAEEAAAVPASTSAAAAVGDAAGGVDARRTAVTTTPSATEARDASLLKTEPAHGRFRFTRKNKFPLSLKSRKSRWRRYLQTRAQGPRHGCTGCRAGGKAAASRQRLCCRQERRCEANGCHRARFAPSRCASRRRSAGRMQGLCYWRLSGGKGPAFRGCHLKLIEGRQNGESLRFKLHSNVLVRSDCALN